MKYAVLGVLTALSGATALSTGAAADQAAIPRSFDRPSPFMRVYGTAQPPHGFVRMCEQHPRDCLASGNQEIRFSATPERLSELDEINRYVNHTIKPATDMELYGVSEYWTIPKDRGDCEDYALLKRQLLLNHDWPTGALLMTVVRDEKGEGHAVLTVRTAQGDYVLDNKVDDVRLWYKTPYSYVMRQSFLNPRVWVSLDPSDAGSQMQLASGLVQGR